MTRLTGWGALDGAAAIGSLDGPLPPRDAHEPNDDAGEAAYRLYFPAGEKARFVKASVDFWDDQDDVYAVHLRRGERLLRLARPRRAPSVVLALWQPGAASVSDLARQNRRVRVSSRPGRRERSRLEGRRGRVALPPGAAHRAERPPVRVPPLDRPHALALAAPPRWCPHRSGG